MAVKCFVQQSMLEVNIYAIGHRSFSLQNLA